MRRVNFVANPALEPEENLSLQLGMNYEKSDWLKPQDQLKLGFGFYRNRITNYIGYGSIIMQDASISPTQSVRPVISSGSTSSVNNREAVIRQGFELNLAYQQPMWYVRGNLTIPLRYNNRMCSVQSPSGTGYNHTTDPMTGDRTYTSIGYGDTYCYSSWNWMEMGRIEPVRGSLTAALTPRGGKLELGSTVHYQSKQRAAYWYIRDRQGSGTNDPEWRSEGPFPDGDG